MRAVTRNWCVWNESRSVVADGAGWSKFNAIPTCTPWPGSFHPGGPDTIRIWKRPNTSCTRLTATERTAPRKRTLVFSLLWKQRKYAIEKRDRFRPPAVAVCHPTFTCWARSGFSCTSRQTPFPFPATVPCARSAHSRWRSEHKTNNEFSGVVRKTPARPLATYSACFVHELGVSPLVLPEPDLLVITGSHDQRYGQRQDDGKFPPADERYDHGHG